MKNLINNQQDALKKEVMNFIENELHKVVSDHIKSKYGNDETVLEFLEHTKFELNGSVSEMFSMTCRFNYNKNENKKVYDTATSKQVAVYFYSGTTHPQSVILFWQKPKSGELFYTIDDDIYTNRQKYNHYAVGVLAEIMAERPVFVDKIPTDKEEYDTAPFLVINKTYKVKYNIDEINALTDTVSKYDDLTQDKVLSVLLY